MGTGGKIGKLFPAIQTGIDTHPETEAFRENLTLPFAAAAARSVDQPFGAMPLRAEKGGLPKGAVTAHLAVKKQPFHGFFSP